MTARTAPAAPAGPAPARERIRRFLQRFCTALAQEETRRLLTITIGNPEVVPGLDDAMRTKHDAMRHMFEELTKICATGQAEGELRPDLSPRVAAEIIVSTVTGLVGLRGLGLDDELTSTEHPEATADAVVRGLFR